MIQKIKVGVIGATGYAGQQLVWLLAHHPGVSVQFIASHSFSGESFSSVYGNYRDKFDCPLINQETALDRLCDIDVLFLALPHGHSEKTAQQALANQVKVIDLGADFRLDSSEVYETWYQVRHEFPDLNDEAVYGLPELNRIRIKEARLIASPGCYPTSALLGTYPLFRENLVHPQVIIDSKSGVTGAGRSAKTDLLFCEVNENFKAYGLFSHRHTPEIAQEMSKAAGETVNVLFTPHLIPINRGILSTMYLDLKAPLSQEALLACFRDHYKEEYFVRIIDGLPEIKHVKNSNLCEIGLRVDERSNKVIVVSVIDNLIKGAGGQAIQSMNILTGIPETTGLTQLSMYL